MIAPINYEKFVQGCIQELMNSEGVHVYHLKEYIGRVSGRKIKIDVSFETHVLGSKILVLVECKYYKNKIDVSEVEEFHSKLDDIGAHKGIIVSTVGYSEGAERVAKGRGIALALLSEDASQNGLVYITKKLDPVKDYKVSNDFLGNIKLWGGFSDEKYNKGFQFKSVDQMLDLIRLSMFGEIST